jgi:tight adherence protein C
MSVGADQLLSMMVFLAVFLGMCGLALLVSYFVNADARRASARLKQLPMAADELVAKPSLTMSALPMVGALLAPDQGIQREKLRMRLLQAGYYRPQALHVFLGAKVVLAMVLPLMALWLIFMFGHLTFRLTLLAVSAPAFVGVLIPGFWVDAHKRKRHSQLREALADALDMLVLCAEGGLSLAAALQRVTGELRQVHPLLGAEMEICQREMQLGLSAGQALSQLADRCDLDEMRQLASMLLQAERFGTSVVKALRIFADTCRQERFQRAEEMAQKAAVKILFPTLLCIFPAVFVVVLGPAAYQISTMFNSK